MANKNKRCRNCKEYKLTESMKHVFGAYYCDIECMKDYGMKSAPRVKEKKRKDQKRKDNLRKKELMSRSKWFDKYKVVVNQWVLHVRDAGKPCFTCGTTNPNIKYDAGHRYHAGRGGADRRRFELKNIHKQCSVQCNQYGGGMPKEYDLALAKEYGEDFVEFLSCEVNYPTLKELFPTWQDIEKEIKRFRVLIREAGLTPNA
jgi:hypothetical protein